MDFWTSSPLNVKGFKSFKQFYLGETNITTSGQFYRDMHGKLTRQMAAIVSRTLCGTMKHQTL